MCVLKEKFFNLLNLISLSISSFLLLEASSFLFFISLLSSFYPLSPVFLLVLHPIISLFLFPFSLSSPISLPVFDCSSYFPSVSFNPDCMVLLGGSERQREVDQKVESYNQKEARTPVWP